MPSLEEIEAEYVRLTAKVTYDEFDGCVSDIDIGRLGELATLRLKLTAPDLSHFARAVQVTGNAQL